MRAWTIAVPIGLLWGALMGGAACGGDDDGTGAGGAGASAGAGTGGAGTAGTAGSGGSSGGGAGTTGSVLMHHNHPNRDGVYIDAAITKAAAATLHVDPTFAMATYTGMVTAQPLYLKSAGSVPDVVIIATNQNHVIAFNAATGGKVWDQTLGAPVPQSTLAPLKSAQCGNASARRNFRPGQRHCPLPKLRA